MNKTVGVYWNDIRYYFDNEKHGLSRGYTEGKLVEENDQYLLIKDPETLMTSSEKDTENHPKEKPYFYAIPRSLITDITRF